MKSTTKKAPAKKAAVLSDVEIEALKDTKRERKKGGANGEADLLAAVVKLDANEQAMGRKLHEIVMATAPSLAPKTWYGMPAWANAAGKTVVFFKPASKFKVRYAELGFNEEARLDDGNMWPTAFALVKLDEAEERKIKAMVKKAVG